MAGPGALILGCEGKALSPDEAAFFRDADPWGFILFGRNVADPAQLSRLCADLRAAVGREAPVLIDQEGGRVARLGPPHWREWLAPLHQAELAGGQAARVMYLRYRLIAAELQALGIDVNCAPVIDIARAETHPVLKDRCYGQDVVRVAEIAGSVAQALLDGGVLPVLKHLPGQGRASTDSHRELPRLRTGYRALRWADFMAFEPLAELPLGMLAHVVYEAIDPERPASQSPEVIGLLRAELGFRGLLIGDDLSMEALSGSLAQRAAASRAAGCDLVLHCSGELAEMRAVAAAAGRLDGAAAARARAALDWRRAPLPIDIPAVEAEFRALTDI